MTCAERELVKAAQEAVPRVKQGTMVLVFGLLRDEADTGN